MKVQPPVGILNPFEEPKPSPPAIDPCADMYGLEDEEAALRPKPQLDLDGDSYVLRFEGDSTAEHAAEALVALIYDVNQRSSDHLNARGVWVDVHPPFRGCMSLTRKSKTIHVLADNEVSAFRRLGAALWTLPDKKILNRHGVKIIRRA